MRLIQGDFVELAPTIDPADAVTFDRVTCCHPDMERLVGLSAAKARFPYGAVYPRDVWWVRLALTTENPLRRVHGSPLRAFVHLPRTTAALRLSPLNFARFIGDLRNDAENSSCVIARIPRARVRASFPAIASRAANSDPSASS